jgi:hypothetical protein
MASLRRWSIFARVGRNIEGGELALPEFNNRGDLHVAVHRATLAEIMSRFSSGSVRRAALSARLERIYEIAASTGSLRRFVVFGSFVTAEMRPRDVDIFMIMDDNFDVGRLRGEAALVFDHLLADAHFGCSVFWVRRMAAFGGEQVAVEDWQIKRDGTRRGIIEIISE